MTYYPFILDSGRFRPSVLDNLTDGNGGPISSTFRAICASDSDLSTAVDKINTGLYTRAYIFISGSINLVAGKVINLTNMDLYIVGQNNSSSTPPTLTTNNGAYINASKSRIFVYNLTVVSGYSNGFIFPDNTENDILFYGVTYSGYGVINSHGSANSNVKFRLTGGFYSPSSGYALVDLIRNPANNTYSSHTIVLTDTTVNGRVLNVNGGTAGITRVVSNSYINSSKIIDTFSNGCWKNDSTNPATVNVYYSNFDSTVSQSLVSGSGTINFIPTNNYGVTGYFEQYVGSQPSISTAAYQGQEYYSGNYWYKCISGNGSTGTWIRTAVESSF